MFTLSDYDYTLPEALVAQSPVSHRADSRLLKLLFTGGDIHRIIIGLAIPATQNDVAVAVAGSTDDRDLAL